MIIIHQYTLNSTNRRVTLSSLHIVLTMWDFTSKFATWKSAFDDPTQDLSWVRTLTISDPDPTHAPDSVMGWLSTDILPRVTSLRLYQTPVPRLPDSVGELTTLRSIIIIGPDVLVTLPESINYLHRLARVRFEWSSIASLPASMSQLTTLVDLVIHQCNALECIPSLPLSLQSFQCNYCHNLTNLLHTFNQCAALTSLDIAYCSNLTIISGPLPSTIKVVNISGCSRLSGLPISPSDQVQYLSSMDNMPAWGAELLSRMTRLQELNLSRCDTMSNLPSIIDNLITLRDLCLKGCRRLVRLPETIDRLSGLISLNLAGCTALSCLPESIGHLTALKYLSLGSCALTRLPTSIGQLSGLTILTLFDNPIARLPDQIGNLCNLTTLYLSNCTALTVLPSSIGRLSALQHLDLEGCSSLQTLPESMCLMASLITLDLHHCHITDPPATVVAKGLPSVMEYLSHGQRVLALAVATNHALPSELWELVYTRGRFDYM